MPRETSFTLTLAGCLLAAAIGCDSSPAGESAARTAASGGRVSGEEAHRLVEQEGATLLDVRTAQEYAVRHAEGAVNIPVGELPGRVAELPSDKPVVVYCQSGARSATAAGLLRARGYAVFDLGSLSAW